MAFQILLNIVIAILWMALQFSYTAVDFVIGYLVGAAVLYFLRGVLNEEFYMRKVFAIVKLTLLFIKELVVANIDMIGIVLSPNFRDVTPSIIAMPTNLKTDWEVTILSMLISLTPGTLTMDYSEDGRTLYIHGIHVERRQEMIKEIRDGFERAIQEVFK